jgi:SAM-dependent methyltransferase
MYGRAFAERMNASYFDGRLAPAVLDRLSLLPVDREDARAFVERMFRLMHGAGFGASDVSVLQADILAALLSRLLPGNWEGRVPPITIAGRHSKLDQLVAQTAAEDRLPQTFIDIACGFPPLTTVDTANTLAGWQVTGVDRSLPAYLVTDSHGNYAVFDVDGRATYFQPLAPSPESWTVLLGDWEGSRRRFERLLQSLLAERTRLGGADHVEHDGARLEVHPTRAYAHDRLRFVASDLGDARLPPAGVVRCCNMLMYFDHDFRRAALAQLADLLEPDGLLLCGTDWVHTTEARYFSHRKRSGGLSDSEFAFSIDNVAPLGILPWYTLTDDDVEVETLMGMVAILRADRRFIDGFMEAADALRAELGLPTRGSDRDEAPAIQTGSPADLTMALPRYSERLAATFGVSAVDALSRQGLQARVNGVGHIAVAVPAA